MQRRVRGDSLLRSDPLNRVAAYRAFDAQIPNVAVSVILL